MKRISFAEIMNLVTLYLPIRTKKKASNWSLLSPLRVTPKCFFIATSPPMFEMLFYSTKIDRKKKTELNDFLHSKKKKQFFFLFRATRMKHEWDVTFFALVNHWILFPPSITIHALYSIFIFHILSFYQWSISTWKSFALSFSSFHLNHSLISKCTRITTLVTMFPFYRYILVSFLLQSLLLNLLLLFIKLSVKKIETSDDGDAVFY